MKENQREIRKSRTPNLLVADPSSVRNAIFRQEVAGAEIKFTEVGDSTDFARKAEVALPVNKRIAHLN